MSTWSKLQCKKCTDDLMDVIQLYKRHNFCFSFSKQKHKFVSIPQIPLLFPEREKLCQILKKNKPALFSFALWFMASLQFTIVDPDNFLKVARYSCTIILNETVSSIRTKCVFLRENRLTKATIESDIPTYPSCCFLDSKNITIRTFEHKITFKCPIS